MVAKLSGVVFDQIYGDNSGGAEFDTDGDGTATQEDEFVSVRNTTGSDIDISGWEIWSDSQGTGSPDSPQDGKFHTFPPGTVLEAGETLYIINEITGTPTSWMQEASEGGVESGAGGISTNFLTEGGNNTVTEGIALVNPATGEFIVFNMSPSAENVSSLSGFPGTTSVGEDNVSGIQNDQNAGSSFQYVVATDSFVFQAVNVPCFAEGTLIAVPGGERRVEDLTIGDLVETLDHGPQPLLAVLTRNLDFRGGARACHKPIEFKPGSLGSALPSRPMVVSPQHRILVRDLSGLEYLAPAKSLVDRPGVRTMNGCRAVRYYQLVFARHEVVLSEGAWTESFYPGAYAVRTSDLQTKRRLLEIFPEILRNDYPMPARPLLRAREARELKLEADLQTPRHPIRSHAKPALPGRVA